MDRYKKLLASFIEVVTFLLAAFSGFLQKIAPPDSTGASYAVGILSFLLLIVLLIISAISRQARRPAGRTWLVAGIAAFAVALPAAYLYPTYVRTYTYTPADDPNAHHIQASPAHLTEDAKRFVRDNPTESSAPDLERNFPYENIWTKQGLEIAQHRLLIGYAWLVLALCAAIFCLVEANLVERPTAKP